MRKAATARLRLLIAALGLAGPFGLATNRILPPPVTFTAEQDHGNMMEQLGIETLRPGASGNENDPDHANYDELLANPYPTLPDPLRLDDGEKVTSAGMWWRHGCRLSIRACSVVNLPGGRTTAAIRMRPT